MQQRSDHENARRPIARARIPPSMMEAFRRVCKNTGQTMSELLREVIADGLRERGEWPPRAVSDGE